MITVAGTEVAAVLLFINAKMPQLAQYTAWNAILTAFSAIMAFKMFVNCNQWMAAIKRLDTYEL